MNCMIYNMDLIRPYSCKYLSNYGSVITMVTLFYPRYGVQLSFACKGDSHACRHFIFKRFNAVKKKGCNGESNIKLEGIFSKIGR